ncbi:hypothetical protein [Romboutsia ilealis]|uniref:hypothetical protein n=1 Tax=Romboutsia ilealis TaxID=1115758 RepID=UPI00272CD99C|nr:hypothetical protein [Romboutsia ilealis]
MKSFAQKAGRMLNRFGISALSKYNANTAVDEEIMVDKITGEFLIKSREGYVISFDAMARRKSMLENVDHINSMMNMGGNVYLIDLDHLHLPTQIEYEEEILQNKVLLKDKNLNRLLFNIDVDEVVPNTVAEISEHEPIIALKINATKPGENGEIYCVTFTLEKPLSEINNRIIRIEDIVLEVPLNVYKVSLASVKLKKNPNNTCPNSKLFLHNIAVTVE